MDGSTDYLAKGALSLEGRDLGFQRFDGLGLVVAARLQLLGDYHCLVEESVLVHMDALLGLWGAHEVCSISYHRVREDRLKLLANDARDWGLRPPLKPTSGHLTLVCVHLDEPEALIGVAQLLLGHNVHLGQTAAGDPAGPVEDLLGRDAGQHVILSAAHRPGSILNLSGVLICSHQHWFRFASSRTTKVTRVKQHFRRRRVPQERFINLIHWIAGHPHLR
mmetsp:Transcript_26866/g.66917  ORF Transcript_26866/g.66917 Transcript_26866/m.66917 type:complete len:221 (-) Transcript_26866:187-849(-)